MNMSEQGPPQDSEVTGNLQSDEDGSIDPDEDFNPSRHRTLCSAAKSRLPLRLPRNPHPRTSSDRIHPPDYQTNAENASELENSLGLKTSNTSTTWARARRTRATSKMIAPNTKLRTPSKRSWTNLSASNNPTRLLKMQRRRPGK